MTNRTVCHEAAECLPSRELFRSKREGGSSAWKRGVAIFGLAGAPVAGALGACALLIGHLFDTASLAPYFTTAGNALLFAVIPLLLLGAAVLDMLEADLGACRRRDSAPAREVDERGTVGAGRR
jgi:hypothetical protein